MNTKSPYTTIYNRIVNSAVEMLVAHHHWTAEKALSTVSEKSGLFRAYYSQLKAAERAEMERLVVARQKARDE